MTKAKENPHANQPESDDDDAVSLFAKFTLSDNSSHDDDVNDDLESEEDDDEQLDQEDSDTPTDEDEDDEGTDDGEQDADEDDASDEDPWAKAPESLRNEYMSLRQSHDKLSNEHRANSGRVAALNRELNTLRQKMTAHEKANGKPDSNSDLPSAADLKGKSLEQVEEEWPEIAAYLRHMVQKATDTVEQKLTPVESFKQEFENERYQRQRQSEIEKLAQAHPDFQTVGSDPKFRSWLEAQSPGIKAMGDSELAEDNITLLNLYKGTASKASDKAERKPAPRKKSLSDHAEIPRKGASRAKPGLSDDPVQLFNQLVNKSS
ncbi:hypothetical protein [Aliidiomarina maris]|uniref:Scaffolding protein n=1 Tax=Aliidiomarina maris TaxID=531312 RepID=A0A327X3C5_9GAMM|nr:hypothetical protein [Aliidiomarina maris]RAK01610.1 hypothetical protein B0I24_101233 [Aliidiomarina maris]RUO28436.1 hypothetical protein CWE07_01115 [Aliidiomarina maris]